MQHCIGRKKGNIENTECVYWFRIKFLEWFEKELLNAVIWLYVDDLLEFNYIGFCIIMV